ncbi:alginate lyase family protein, partial [candidate division KSB1 bacterium]|nr:alginate lyase family protein [candidate division KSB1 bacterium]
RDAQAAFAHAQLWVLTDSSRYAQKSIEIINAWSETNKALIGGNDKLAGATACIQFCNAAELLKHSDSGWSLTEQQQFETWLRTVLWPLLRDFIPAYNGNWDAIIGQGLISMGIYLDDALIFDHAVNYYLNGIGNGRMSYYVREDSTTQETLRDQGHEQMGIGALAGFAESAWNQGIDLYTRDDYRLLRGIEGTAKRVREIDCQRLPIWESMYNHYHNRLGFAMPYTDAILNAPEYRPEGYGSYRGFGTLFFCRLGRFNDEEKRF